MVNQGSRATKFLFHLLLFFSFFGFAQCRIGEAKTPGPPEAQASEHWSLGVCNPSGLLGKSVLLSGIDTDVIAVSETHLTQVSKSMLVTSLRSHSRFSHVVTGAPMAPRMTSGEAGVYSGVAAVARVPTRALCAAWPPDLFDTGRVQIVGSLLNNVWVTGGIMYGYPQGKLHSNALDRTMLMLDFLIDHMLHVACGPRYLCGDWNFEPSQLPNTQCLWNHGWREVQDLEFQRIGRAPQPTCKHKTQKDVLWLSPELVAAYQGLALDHDRFPDHSVLKAFFDVGPNMAVRYLWPMPHPVPWEKVPDFPTVMDFAVGSPSDLFQDLWTQKESQARHSLTHAWHANMQGRGQRRQPLKRRGWAAPPKKGRSIDFQPAFHGYHVQHARWMKQLRRLQNYHRWAVVHFRKATSNDVLHGVFLWKSILKATGFVPSFSQWWISRHAPGFSDPGVVPEYPPPPALALAFCDSFSSEVVVLERRLLAAKTAARRCHHGRDKNLIYKDTKRPAPEPVSSLLDTTRARVIEVDADDVAVEFEPPGHFDDQRPVLLNDSPVRIIHATDTRLYLDDVTHAEPGALLRQERPVGALDEVFQAFHEQWRARWCRHDEVPHDRWEPLISFALRVLPKQPAPCLRLDGEVVRAEATAKKAHAAVGLDGISRNDVLKADANTLASVCSLYRRAEETGDWPQQITTGRVASLAKKEGAATTNEFRPITIFSLLYRLYSGLNARHLLNWCDTWTHPDVHGNRKGHSTAQLWRTIVTDIQTAYDRNLPLSGLTADIEKCFNCLPRWPILVIALHAGAPHTTLCAWAGALAAMTRRFKVRDSYSTGFLTSTGLAEGCALSCFGMLLLDDVLHRFIQVQSIPIPAGAQFCGQLGFCDLAA